jgi:ankyrin repeat protein
VETVRLLLSLGCSAGHRDSVEQTALFYAARDGRDKVLEILLENGANINDADRLGQTALFYGARDGRTSTVELMLKHVRSFSFLKVSLKKKKDLSCFYFLLKGANIHLNDRNRRTALYYATRSNHREVIALLKSYGNETVLKIS